MNVVRHLRVELLSLPWLYIGLVCSYSNCVVEKGGGKLGINALEYPFVSPDIMISCQRVTKAESFISIFASCLLVEGVRFAAWEQAPLRQLQIHRHRKEELASGQIHGLFGSIWMQRVTTSNPEKPIQLKIMTIMPFGPCRDPLVCLHISKIRCSILARHTGFHPQDHRLVQLVRHAATHPVMPGVKQTFWSMKLILEVRVNHLSHCISELFLFFQTFVHWLFIDETNPGCL